MSSSEDEADYEAIRDVVDCDFIRKCYAVQQDGDKEEKRHSLRTDLKPEQRKDGFAEHVANKLFKRLEREIQVIEAVKENKASPANETRCLKGIKLFNGSTKLLTGNEEEERKKDVAKAEKCRREREDRMRRKVERREEKMRQERAVEAAVSAEWVLTGQGTRGWRDAKKPRVTRVSLSKVTDSGAIVCNVLPDPPNLRA